jgi:aryl-alcohol dehydrogenase-like predicted oxidoreductase
MNFFDTAELYGFGSAEMQMGQAFKELGTRREDIVVSTKLYGSKVGGVNGVGLSRKHIIEGTKNSLKRLQMDYVDVIFAHKPDLETPLEEQCRAFSWVVDQGLAHYWATSEWGAARIMETHETCKRLNLHPPIADQCQYNMLIRNRFEEEYRTLYENFGYGTTTWSPMAGGILSGKYNDGSIPPDSRYAKDPFAATVAWPRYFGSEEAKKKTLSTLVGLKELAAELGYT